MVEEETVESNFTTENESSNVTLNEEILKVEKRTPNSSDFDENLSEKNADSSDLDSRVDVPNAEVEADVPNAENVESDDSNEIGKSQVLCLFKSCKGLVIKQKPIELIIKAMKLFKLK